MIKDVHINNPKPFLRGSNSVPTRLIHAVLARLQIFLKRLGLEGSGKLRARAKLTIASFVIHYFGWQGRSRFGGIVRDGDDLLKRIADTKCAR